MELQIEYRTGNVRVTVQGPEESKEMKQIIGLLQNATNKLWGMDAEKNTVAISVEDILWAETVEDKLFLYTAGAIFQAACSLTSLELRWEHIGLFRCGKSTIINLNAVQRLRSQPGGRIEAVLRNGEKIIISRRYTPALREKLQGG